MKKNGPAPMTIDEVIAKHVIKTTGCWYWTGAIVGNGYGQHGSKKRGQEYIAHRKVYAALVKPIPKGMQIDHLCRIKLCVNPQHLEPVTPAENLLRAPNQPTTINKLKTHCIHGHPFNEENTRMEYGKRVCRTCKSLRNRGLL